MENCYLISDCRGQRQYICSIFLRLNWLEVKNWLTSWYGIFGFFVQVFMTVCVCPPRSRGWIFSWRHHFGSRWHRFGSTVVNIDAAHAWTAFGLPKLVSARALKRLRRIIVVPLKEGSFLQVFLARLLSIQSIYLIVNLYTPKNIEPYPRSKSG